MIHLFGDLLIWWFTYTVIYLFGDLLGDALFDLIIGIDVDTGVDIDIDTGIDVDTDIDTPNTENGIKRCEYVILWGLRCPRTAEIAWQWSNPVTSVSGKIHFWHSYHIM